MNEYYENGPEGMPRVERMTDSTIMAVLSQKNVPTIYVHSEQDYTSLRLFAHAIAEETLARVPSWPKAERTTSPVSQMTDEMRSALMFNAELFESHGFIDQARHLRDIVAAAAPAAPGSDPAPIYKHRDDGTVTLTNTGKMPSYADIDKVAWKIHEARAAQPQDERAAFEVWAVSEEGGWMPGALNRQQYGDDYTDDDVQAEWRSWQARAALAKKGGA